MPRKGDDEVTPDRQKRLWFIGGTALITAAVVGLFTGTRPPSLPELGTVGEGKDSAQRALSYPELREQRRGPNADMYENAFAWLRGQGPASTDPVEQSPEDRQEALAQRRARRAYAGAPPVVPHPVQEREPGACLACHDEGARIAGLRAPPMSHEKLTMCVQCHATERREAPLEDSLGNMPFVNTFQGVAEAGPGQTAWAGAPPTIPHATFMRENCESCHGPQGAHGLRTPHPNQLSCRQCHAPASSFDQNAPPSLPPELVR